MIKNWAEKILLKNWIKKQNKKTKKNLRPNSTQVVFAFSKYLPLSLPPIYFNIWLPYTPDKIHKSVSLQIRNSPRTAQPLFWMFTEQLSGTICLKHSATLILPPLSKPPSRRTCLIIISKLFFFIALPIPSFDAVCVCVCVRVCG